MRIDQPQNLYVIEFDQRLKGHADPAFSRRAEKLIHNSERCKRINLSTGNACSGPLGIHNILLEYDYVDAYICAWCGFNNKPNDENVSQCVETSAYR